MAAREAIRPNDASLGILDRVFKLTEKGTNVKTEILAGLTTFVTMAYIIVVNPATLTLADLPDEAKAGLSIPDWGAVFMATILAAATATLIMGLFANWPFALAPGMGLNAFVSFTLILGMQLPWQTAFAAVAISGMLMLVVTLTGLRQMMIRAIPAHLRHGVGAGIGLFIMFIGLKNAGIIVSNPATFVALGDVTAAPVLLAIIGLVITAALLARRVPGAILIGIAITTLIGIPMGVTQLPDAIVSRPPSILPTLGQLDFSGVLKVSMIPVVFSLFFSDMFDTLGTFMGMAGKAGLLDEKGELKGDQRALFADSIGTVIGAFLGTSNTTTYVESAAGVEAGGRTGLTAVTVAILFLLSIFFSPLALMVPSSATAPALIIVGVLMASSLLQVDLNDFVVAFPVVITVIAMPLTFSIATGLALGFIAYVVVNLAAGRAKDVHWMMYVLSAFFIYYFITH